VAFLGEVLALVAAHLERGSARRPTENNRISVVAVVRNRKMFCPCLGLLSEPRGAQMVGRIGTADQLPQEASPHIGHWGKRLLVGKDCSGQLDLEEAKHQKIVVAQN